MDESRDFLSIRVCRLRIRINIVSKINNSSYISMFQIPRTMDYKAENATDSDRHRSKRKSSAETDSGSSDEKKSRFPDNGDISYDNPHFNTFEKFVYGNPKEPLVSTNTEYDTNVLDLSCKKSSDSAKSAPTYQPHQIPRSPDVPLPVPQRSNLEIKLVPQSGNNSKRPNTMEQLQIAKMQQQQRRSIQQQQKMLQQMRRTLESNATRAYQKEQQHHHREEVPLAEQSQDIPNPMLNYQHNNLSFGKELPDGHPVLPLLDPVYFSALYNAHGFLPPSSPSIAAAFIGTLHEALPKLSMMFPNPQNNNNTTTNNTPNNPLLPQKNNNNPNSN